MEKRVRIRPDDNAESPREFDCNVGRMICWHSRYNLGDDHQYDADNFMEELACEAVADLKEKLDKLGMADWGRLYDRGLSYQDAEVLLESQRSELVDSAVRDNYVILPLYLYDHSGITMSTGSFHCPWDSGQVGWIVCDKETVSREFKGDLELAEKALQCEVEVYDLYLTGDVYGFVVEEFDGDDWNHVDSCWGFYGSDVDTNGMKEHLGAELAALGRVPQTAAPALCMTQEEENESRRERELKNTDE